MSNICLKPIFPQQKLHNTTLFSTRYNLIKVYILLTNPSMYGVMKLGQCWTTWTLSSTPMSRCSWQESQQIFVLSGLMFKLLNVCKPTNTQLSHSHTTNTKYVLLPSVISFYPQFINVLIDSQLNIVYLCLCT